MDENAIIAIVGSLGGLLTIITGFLLKLHCNRSNCNACKCCEFDITFDSEEVENLRRHRTERRKRESEQQDNNEYIEVEPEQENHIYDKLNHTILSV